MRSSPVRLILVVLVAAIGCDRDSAAPPERATTSPSLSAASVPEAASAPAGEGWLTLKAPDTQVVLRYPPSWKVLDEGFGVEATDGPHDGANCNVMVGVAASEPDHETRLKRFDAGFSTEHFTRVLERREPIVAGLRGRWLLADYDQPRAEGIARTRQIQAHAPRSGRLYQLTCTSHRSTFERRRPTFDAIVERWEVPTPRPGQP